MPARPIGRRFHLTTRQILPTNPVLSSNSRARKSGRRTRMRTPRRPANPHEAAEALFKPVKRSATPAVERPALPNAKELVTLKLDSEVLAHFQAGGPGW